MTTLSENKKFRRDICKTVGHTWEPYVDNSRNGLAIGGNLCSRCKKREETWRSISCTPVVMDTFKLPPSPKVKYADLNVRRYDPFNRAKDRGKED